MEPLSIPQHDIDDLRAEAQLLLAAADLPELLKSISAGPYGTTVGHLRILDGLERGLAIVVGCRRALAGRIAADRRAGFAGGVLEVAEQRFCSLAAANIGLQEALASLELAPEKLPPSDRHLKIDEYRALLGQADEIELARGLLADMKGYLNFYRDHPDAKLRPADDARLLACVGSYLALAAKTALRIADDGEYAPTMEALREAGLTLGSVRYRGFERKAQVLADDESDLLKVMPEDVVGNEDVKEAALKLCRAVAGFDLERGENPRLVRNPVIFVLGAPGCGKTVTAHAVGNYFLDLCKKNGTPARFRVIRRTDWASHFQNKSANELLRIFQEEIFDFHGVAGVYWPDIDTAFAARDDPGARAEDKAVLGTLFGLLDGTVGPRNGKWFLIADANYMTMDEAMLSRLTQDPHYAKGPQTAEDYVELMRDKKLARVGANLAIEDSEWLAFGQRCIDEGLSGRAVDNMAGKILSTIEDIDLPDDYFSMTFEAKQALLETKRLSFDNPQLVALLERYIEFEKDAENRARTERFDRRVTEIRERIAAQVAAVSGSEGGPGE